MTCSLFDFTVFKQLLNLRSVSYDVGRMYVSYESAGMLELALVVCMSKFVTRPQLPTRRTAFPATMQIWCSAIQVRQDTAKHTRLIQRPNAQC